jgi:hypothetical protein
MLTKLRLGIPLLIVLALVAMMLALPTRSATAASVNSICRRSVSFKGEFNTIFQLIPITQTLFKAPVFGNDGSIFIGNRRVGGLVVIDQVVNFVTSTIDGNATLITTDGSRIFIKGTGAAGPQNAAGTSPFSGEWEIFGGTGTYQGAKGAAVFEGEANIPTLKGFFSFEGYIRIPCAT